MGRRTGPQTIDDLTPHPRNPRRIKDAAAKGLRASMTRFGDLSGITYNAKTGRLVCGHQRVKELRELGYRYVNGALTNGETDFPVRIVDWDEQLELEANVAANNQEIQGEWFEVDELLREIRAGMDVAEFEELQFDVLEEQFAALGMGPEKDGALEVDENDLGGQQHECPRCGFQF